MSGDFDIVSALAAVTGISWEEIEPDPVTGLRNLTSYSHPGYVAQVAMVGERVSVFAGPSGPDGPQPAPYGGIEGASVQGGRCASLEWRTVDAPHGRFWTMGFDPRLLAGTGLERFAGMSAGPSPR